MKQIFLSSFTHLRSVAKYKLWIYNDLYLPNVGKTMSFLPSPISPIFIGGIIIIPHLFVKMALFYPHYKQLSKDRMYPRFLTRSLPVNPNPWAPTSAGWAFLQKNRHFPRDFFRHPPRNHEKPCSVGIETWDILGHLGTLAWGVEYYPLVMTFTVRHG